MSFGARKPKGFKHDSYMWLMLPMSEAPKYIYPVLKQTIN